MNQEIESLAQISDELTGASLARYGDLLSKRRVVLTALMAHHVPPGEAKDFADAFRSGNEIRSRLLIELAGLREKIEDLRRLHAGLGQLRPIGTSRPSLDIRL